MDVGVFYFPSDYGIDVSELARTLEVRGFESLFLPEHTNIPVSRKTPYPGGGELPKCYVHSHDPFVALAFAAAATKRLKLGTGVCLVPQRDPIITAKTIASLDVMSGGRFIFGIGAGWNQDEMENHGTVYETRYNLMRERVLAMKAMWTQDAASYHGDLVRIEPSWVYPKPEQKPHPPILLGGDTDHTLRRVVAWCDGWIPLGRRGFDAAAQVERLHKAAEAAKRDPATLSITVFGAAADKAALDACRQAGIERVLLQIPDQSRDEILRLVDQLAPLTK